MTFSLLSRWTLIFWLEALLIGGALMLLGWITASFGQLLFFCLAASLLLLAGSWLYHHGGRHSLLHLLLYPVVLGVGVLSYCLYGSWLIALALTGIFYWRVQTAVANGLGHSSMQRRFVLAFMVCLIQLVVAALYGTMVHPETFTPAPYFGMLALVTGSYVLISLAVFLLREESLPVRLPGSLGAKLAAQVVGTRLLLTVGYIAAASVVLGLLGFVWSWVKGPLGAGLYMLIEPVLLKLADWIGGLSQVLNKDQRVHNALDGQGQSENLPLDPVQQGEPLFSVLEPYLIALVILVSLIFLGWYMWKRRRRAEHTAAPADNTDYAANLSALPPTVDGDAAAWDVSQWFKKPIGPEDDPTRYAYYQFLQAMAKRGVTVQPYETTQEFFKRLQYHPVMTAPALELAAKITGFYEQYRYQEHSLSPEELADMQQAVQALAAHAENDSQSQNPNQSQAQNQ